MGNQTSSDDVKEQKAQMRKELAVTENKFRKMQLQSDEDGPNLSRAMTFDDRRLLSAKTRKQIVGPGMKRSVTFVNKVRVQAPPPATLNDVMFKKHFGNEDAPASARSVLPVSFIPEVEAIVPQRRHAVVVVDTFSTGFMLAYQAYVSGYQVISVFSADLGDLASLVAEGLEFSLLGSCTLDNSMGESMGVEKLIAEINNFGVPVDAVLAGAETGVELADELATRMGLRTNGTELSEARRNKFVMGETVRNAGVRAVKQLIASTWSEINDFIAEWQPNPFKVIVKPNDSAGSDDVTLCLSIEDVQKAFGHIIGKVNGLGLVNKAVLVQEYLEGTEYVIDMVSKDGEHKLIGVWEYDRRPANGAGFVCHGQKTLLSTDARVPEMMAYQKQVITALGVQHGPTHGEVKWFQDAPCLVEVGARCHGGEGIWVGVANEAYGYNQVNATVDAYLNDTAWNAIPAECTARQNFGALKYLISYQSGVLVSIKQEAIDEITSMESYRGHQLFAKVGKMMHPTISCFTWAGVVRLVHADESKLNADYQRVEELQQTMFVVEVPPVPKPVEAVVIVDPFSTGASLAAHCYAMGYKIIAVYSAELDKLANLTNLIPQGLTLEFEAIIGFEADIGGMATKVRACGFPVMAIMAGAETGVELADALSSNMGLRSNGTAQSEARRNKFVMGETVRRAGVRAVKQKVVTEWQQVEAFLDEWQPNPFKVIVKPTESAGSEDVTLCLSPEELREAYHRIMGKVNGLGLVNKAVLVQEYLEGTEYVIDMVSVDGHHKVVAVWEYDKGPCNGAKFVMFGMRPLLATDDRIAEIIAYQKQVITALGVQHGPTHGEVKWFQDAPCLVEVGARCHGGEGTWLPVANAFYGYSQVEVTAAAYLNQSTFSAYPDNPVANISCGKILCLIVKVTGKLVEISPDLIEEMRQMRSFGRCEIYVKLGQDIVPTVNGFTFGGVVVLKHAEQAVVDADYARIREMEDQDLFVVA